MVLRDDTINQQLLIPLDLRDLIPKRSSMLFYKKRCRHNGFHRSP